MNWYTLFKLTPINGEVLMLLPAKWLLPFIYSFAIIFIIITIITGVQLWRIKEPKDKQTRLALYLYLIFAAITTLSPFLNPFDIRTTSAYMSVILIFVGLYPFIVGALKYQTHPRHFILCVSALIGSICHYIFWFLLMWLMAGC